MDDLLKLAADAGLHVTDAEEALAAGEHQAARDAVDRADDALGALRERWPSMTAPQRGLVGTTAAPLRRRLDAVRAGLPKVSALSTGTPETDPEQDAPPPGGDDGPV
jgi:hypothetical protein